LAKVVEHAARQSRGRLTRKLSASPDARLRREDRVAKSRGELAARAYLGRFLLEVIGVREGVVVGKLVAMVAKS
jgi:hypothetical protein